jgi:hypothetical protein
MRITSLSRLEHESLQGNSGKFLARTLGAFFEKRRRGGSVRRLHLAQAERECGTAGISKRRISAASDDAIA